jgi:hypothetical protein
LHPAHPEAFNTHADHQSKFFHVLVGTFLTISANIVYPVSENKARRYKQANPSMISRSDLACASWQNIIATN